MAKYFSILCNMKVKMVGIETRECLKINFSFDVDESLIGHSIFALLYKAFFFFVILYK